MNGIRIAMRMTILSDMCFYNLAGESREIPRSHRAMAMRDNRICSWKINFATLSRASHV